MNISRFKTDILSLRNKLKTIEDEKEADKIFVESLAGAMERLIKSVSVEVKAKPSDVQVQGSAQKQRNITTLSFKGNKDSYGGGLT